MKERVSRKSFVCFVLVIILVNLSIPAIAAAQRKNVQSIEVQVIINSYDEDYIKSVVLDDGSKIGDYDYVISYISAPRSYGIARYFNYAAWITRDDGITLSLEPKDTVRISYDEKEDAWDLLRSSDSGYGGQSRWQNEQCMKWQFDCHYSFANTKTYWNIEPWRTASSYIQVVASACNP